MRLQRRPDGTISLLISDNGRGFQPKLRRAENLGLIGMHERMAAIGGKLQIRTSPGRGVTIRAAYFQQIEESRGIASIPQIRPREQEVLHGTLSTFKEA
jgi:signal transduction histidine kinase